MDSPYPMSQGDPSQPQIFLHPEGRPFCFWVQVQGFDDRPRVLRSIRNSGGIISTREGQADIILVDSGTPAGRQFIRLYGSLKPVLEHSWVRKCIAAGRVMLEDDDWGGCATLDDGQPLGDEEYDDRQDQSPLPTPRPTPTQSVRGRSGPENSSQSSISHSDSGSKRSVPRIIAKAAPESRSRRSPHQQSSSRPIDSFSRQGVDLPPQHQHYPGPSAYQSSEPSLSQIPAIQPQISPSATTFPSTSPNIFSQAQPPQFQAFSQQHPFAALQNFPAQYQQLFQLSSGQQQQPTTFPFSPPNITSPFATQSVLPLVPQMPVSFPFPMNGGVDMQASLNFMLNMFDILRYQNAMNLQVRPAAVAQGLSAFPNGVESAMVSQPSQEDSKPSSPPFSQDTSAAQDVSTDGGPAGDLTDSSMGLPSESSSPMSKPSMRRSSTSNKGKRRAATPPHSSGMLMGTPPRDMSPQSTDNSISTPHSPRERRRTVIAHKPIGEIFADPSGQPLRFFVQVDLNGRQAVVSNIKRNKGRIVNNTSDADFVILSSRSKTFTNLLVETLRCHKIPLQSSFVNDCVEEKALLDENDYELDYTGITSSVLRRVQAFHGKASSPAKLTQTPNKPTSHTQLSDSTQRKRKSAKCEPIVVDETSSDSPADARSPSPPPLESRRKWGTGKFLFSQDDMQCFSRYARFLIEHNPSITNTLISKKLSNKMPHHSQGSWLVAINQHKTELADIRKRVGIKLRKQQHAQSSQQVPPVGDDSHPQPKKLKVDHVEQEQPAGETSNNPQPSPRSAHEEDIDSICRFFVFGVTQNPEGDIWEKLDEQGSCRSAPSWSDFFSANENEIMEGIYRLSDQDDQGLHAAPDNAADTQLMGSHVKVEGI